MCHFKYMHTGKSDERLKEKRYIMSQRPPLFPEKYNVSHKDGKLAIKRFMKTLHHLYQRNILHENFKVKMF